MNTIVGNLIDIKARDIYPVKVTYDHCIQSIEKINEEAKDYILPGFIDAHIHIESSLLIPSEFARIAVLHGTVGTVSDPHEIANVLGVKGVDFMINNGKQVNFKFNFGAPSCVPATQFETAGASINANEVEKLMARNEIKYLAEMMNWPGVLDGDPEVLRKIAIALELGKPVDGHAPGLTGKQASDYIRAGIQTDHECFTYEEAVFKLAQGMKILIREGSAAKNFGALIDLFDDHAKQLMFCSDDRHPDFLVKSHINEHVLRALAKGKDLFDVLHAACIAPVEHYGLDIGMLRKGDPADFIMIDHPNDFNILKTIIDGKTVAKSGESYIKSVSSELPNHFSCKHKRPEEFHTPLVGQKIHVIEALDGQLITKHISFSTKMLDADTQTNTEEDILKIAVINRYEDKATAIGFIKNFGLQKGAMASSVAHDSHNIVAVGTNDKDLSKAVNLIIEAKGGLSVACDDFEDILPLPVAGLMSHEDGFKVAQKYEALDQVAKHMLGSTLTSPFMTLSFMALLVIPSLKLSDKGLFDTDKFEFCKISSD